LKNLRPWKKGESGNPGGRPSKKPITEAVLAVLGEDPKLLRKIALNAAKKAAKDKHWFDSVRDTIQGRPIQEVSGPEGAPIPMTVEGIDEAILKLIAAAKERQEVFAEFYFGTARRVCEGDLEDYR
jgi:hypothetical protein